MLRFSIIVPVYNAARYLPACLASLLDQQGAPDYEVFCIDDGSTDESPALLDAAAKEHPDCVVVLHTKNQGSILARREGILRAKGEYLLFADADDFMESDCLKTLDARLKETGADILLYNYAAFSEGQAPISQTPLYADGRVFEGEGKTSLYERMIAGWSLNNLWNKAIRAALLQEDPTDFAYYADNPMGDDLLLSLEPMTEARRIAYCDKPLYRYRKTAGGLTQTFDERRYRRLCDGRIVGRLREYLPRWGLEDAEHILSYQKRLLLQRIDTAMSFYRHAADSAARRAVLARDWLKNLPMDAAELRRTAAALPVKQRVQLFCIRYRLRAVLNLLLRLNKSAKKRA